MPNDHSYNVAVVSQGPSWKHYHNDLASEYAYVIGVNAIPTMVECDYWAFGDHGTFAKYKDSLIDDPIILTKQASSDKLATKDDAIKRWMDSPGSFVVYENLDLPNWTYPDGCTRFSGLIALGLAWSLKPRLVDCYGVDLQGDDGAVPGTNRTPDRWQTERRVWAQMARMMEDHGIVVRHAKGGGEFMPTIGVEDAPPVMRRYRLIHPIFGQLTGTFQAVSKMAMKDLLIRQKGESLADQFLIEEVQ